MRVSVDELIIEVTARPGASRCGVTGVSGERLAIGVNARPEKGKANDDKTNERRRKNRNKRSKRKNEKRKKKKATK